MKYQKLLSSLLGFTLLTGCATSEETEIALEIDDPLSLTSAMVTSDYDRMVSLLESGYPVKGLSEHENEPAFWAISYDYREALRILILHGLDVNYDWGERGGNLLTNAVQFGHLEIVRILIDAGASVTRDPERGRSPLYSAIIYGHEDIEDYLRSKGAELNAWDIEAFARVGIDPEEHRTNRER